MSILVWGRSVNFAAGKFTEGFTEDFADSKFTKGDRAAFNLSKAPPLGFFDCDVFLFVSQKFMIGFVSRIFPSLNLFQVKYRI